jgi:DNA-binding transcriptional regulator YhcF (GntR family)
VKTLQLQGALSSFQAQEELGLKTCDWAPATLRRFFSELEDEGVIVKQGQKRGTRYVWKGTSHQTRSTPAAKLVKRVEED